MSGIADTTTDNLKADATKDTGRRQNVRDASDKLVETNKLERSTTNDGGNINTQAAAAGYGDHSFDSNNNSLGGEVNMEASITSDDVLRAGGLGARDDMSSFLPVAVDSTDFEASLRDAGDYEEVGSQAGKINRPGLGWTG